MNNAIDLSGLIKGILAVIGIALALGQYPKLEHWSREQAAESLAWKRGLPHFFAAVHAHQKIYHAHANFKEENGGRK